MHSLAELVRSFFLSSKNKKNVALLVFSFYREIEEGEGVVDQVEFYFFIQGLSVPKLERWLTSNNQGFSF